MALVAWVASGIACGGSQTGAKAAPSPSASVADAGPDAADAAPDAPVVRPFAKSIGEAQTMIQEQIDRRMTTLWSCVDAYRTRKNDPHRSVVLDIGIDQEGHVLGLTAVGKHAELEPTLRDCVWTSLHGLPFPRSHAGVITVRQSFTDAATQQ